jgi:protein-S-isoprenylcysteine O-methyltransferase Ste14
MKPPIEDNRGLTLRKHFIAVSPEERYLTEKFGPSYTSYLGQVRRCL